MGISLVFGLIIMVMIYAGGHLSGAHYNPSVTFAFTLARHFPPRDAIVYVAAQLAGAVAGALLLRAAWTDAPADLGATVPTVGAGTALLYEIVLTAFLMFVITAVAADTRAAGAAAAIAIGGTVALDALFGGPVTGAWMNTASLFGPALIAGHCGATSGSTSPDRSRARPPACWRTSSSGAHDARSESKPRQNGCLPLRVVMAGGVQVDRRVVLGEQLCDQLTTARHADLVEDRLDVVAHRVDREEQPASDLGGADALGDELGDLPLSRDDSS